MYFHFLELSSSLRVISNLGKLSKRESKTSLAIEFFMRKH